MLTKAWKLWVTEGFKAHSLR